MSSHQPKASRTKGKDGNPSTSYTCHICATDVPAAFSEAHDASSRHRANASIMAAASERMRAMVTARPPPRTARPVGTYCAICNLIADSDHKKTAKHKQAVRDDHLMSMLANLYCGGEEEEEEDDDDDDEADDDDDSADEIRKSRVDTKMNKDSSDVKVNNTTKVANQIDIERAVEDDGEDVPDEISKNQDIIDKNKGPGDAKVNNPTKMANPSDLQKTLEDAFDGLPDEISKSQDDTDKNKNPSNANVNNANKIVNPTDVERAVEQNAYKHNEITKSKNDGNADKKHDMQRNNLLEYEQQNAAANFDSDEEGGEIDKSNAKNNTKGNAHSRNGISIGNANAIKTDQQTKYVDNNKIKQASSVASDPYDPNHNFFWALVKRFKIEQPWRTRYITIHPAGSNIQIYVEKKKFDVSYDSFHSFHRNEGKCLLCRNYFDTHFSSEDEHIMSKEHMSRIMLPVNDTHCFRKIDDWFHCILCNDTFHIHSEAEHKVSTEHRQNKMEATVDRPLFDFNDPNMFVVIPTGNVQVRDRTSRYTETEARRKITLQKQETVKK